MLQELVFYYETGPSAYFIFEKYASPCECCIIMVGPAAHLRILKMLEHIFSIENSSKLPLICLALNKVCSTFNLKAHSNDV